MGEHVSDKRSGTKRTVAIDIVDPNSPLLYIHVKLIPDDPQHPFSVHAEVRDKSSADWRFGPERMGVPLLRWSTTLQGCFELDVIPKDYPLGSEGFVYELRDNLEGLQNVIGRNNSRIGELIVQTILDLAAGREVNLDKLDYNMKSIDKLFKTGQQGWANTMNR